VIEARLVEIEARLVDAEAQSKVEVPLAVVKALHLPTIEALHLAGIEVPHPPTIEARRLAGIEVLLAVREPLLVNIRPWT